MNPENGGNSASHTHTGLHHGVTSQEIYLVHYTEAGSGLQAVISMIGIEVFCWKLSKITEEQHS